MSSWASFTPRPIGRCWFFCIASRLLLWNSSASFRKATILSINTPLYAGRNHHLSLLLRWSKICSERHLALCLLGFNYTFHNPLPWICTIRVVINVPGSEVEKKIHIIKMLCFGDRDKLSQHSPFSFVFSSFLLLFYSGWKVWSWWKRLSMAGFFTFFAAEQLSISMEFGWIGNKLLSRLCPYWCCEERIPPSNVLVQM